MEKLNEAEKNNTGKIIGAALIGAAIGGALGILFAPAKGSDTRKSLLAKGEKIKASFLEQIAELMDAPNSTNNEEKVDVSKNGNTTA